MDDRTLIERAAKAAGHRIEFRDAVDGVAPVLLDEGGSASLWNPLASDAQAFRLALDCHICVIFGACLDDAPIVQCGPEHDRFNFQSWPQTPNFPDARAATRRAITRAAAALAAMEK